MKRPHLRRQPMKHFYRLGKGYWAADYVIFSLSPADIADLAKPGTAPFLRASIGLHPVRSFAHRRTASALVELRVPVNDDGLGEVPDIITVTVYESCRERVGVRVRLVNAAEIRGAARAAFRGILVGSGVPA